MPLCYMQGQTAGTCALAATAAAPRAGARAGTPPRRDAYWVPGHRGHTTQTGNAAATVSSDNAAAAAVASDNAAAGSSDNAANIENNAAAAAAATCDNARANVSQLPEHEFQSDKARGIKSETRGTKHKTVSLYR